MWHELALINGAIVRKASSWACGVAFQCDCRQFIVEVLVVDGEGFPDWEALIVPAHDLPTEPLRWADTPGWTDAVGHEPFPASWTFGDTITTELAPKRTAAQPTHGWRKWIHTGTFGLVAPGPSSEELRQATLEATISSPLRGRFKFGVVGKGGVGKTSIAAGVGSIFAELRRADRVVAIDADTAFGHLSARIDPHAVGSYWDLAAGRHLDSFADIRTSLGCNAAGLFVLAGEAADAGRRRRVLDPFIYREAAIQLDRHFTLVIVDCGSSLDSAVTREALRDLDALIVVGAPRVDGASLAVQKLEWLAGNGMERLLERTIIVLNHSDGHADRDTRAMWREELLRHDRPVIEMPFDPHLRTGGVIDVSGPIVSDTRQRYIEIAAAIAGYFADTIG